MDRNRNDSLAKEMYLDVEAKALQKVLHVKGELRKKIKKFEINFINDHERDPMREDYEKFEMLEQYKRYNMCKEILWEKDISL